MARGMGTRRRRQHTAAIRRVIGRLAIKAQVTSEPGSTTKTYVYCEDPESLAETLVKASHGDLHQIADVSVVEVKERKTVQVLWKV